MLKSVLKCVFVVFLKFLLMVNHSYNKQGIPTFLLLAIATQALAESTNRFRNKNKV